MLLRVCKVEPSSLEVLQKVGFQPADTAFSPMSVSAYDLDNVLIFESGVTIDFPANKSCQNALVLHFKDLFGVLRAKASVEVNLIAEQVRVIIHNVKGISFT